MTAMFKKKSNNVYKFYPVIAMMISLMMLCLLVDVNDIMSRTYSSNQLGHVACSARPYLVFSDPLFSSLLLKFIDDQCAHQMLEPATSIILFMFKIALIIPTIVILTVLEVFIPIPDTNVMQKIYDQLRTPGGILKHLQKSAWYALGFALAAFYFFFKTTLFETPENYRFDVSGKFVEDLVIFLIFMAGMCLSAGLSQIIAFKFKQRELKTK